jgi:hypothetical protein
MNTVEILWILPRSWSSADTVKWLEKRQPTPLAMAEQPFPLRWWVITHELVRMP